jgi:hypothetical protein
VNFRWHPRTHLDRIDTLGRRQAARDIEAICDGTHCHDYRYYLMGDEA